MTLGRMKWRPRRLTIGLGIGRDAVRAVALRGGHIAWALERARGEEPLAKTIEDLLADAPVPRWPRSRVIAAVGPLDAQMKRLAGLPPVSDPSRLDDVVRESASRFFLRNGVPLATTCSPAREASPWGAAVEVPVLDAIARACRTRRVRLEAIVPTASVLAFVLDGATEPRCVEWRDGDASWHMVLEGGELVTVRRAAASSERAEERDTPSSALRALGPDGWRFADAFGAARVGRSAPLAWRGDRRGPGSRTVPAWRLAFAGTAVVIAASGWLVAPGVAARFVEHEAAERLTSLAQDWRDVVVAEREVDKVTRALAEVSAFDASGYSMTRMLGDLTRALPDESALVTLRLARESGSLVALTPRAASVLDKLESVRGIEGTDIVGPVTRELVAGKTLERVTVRFRVSSTARRGDSAGRGGVR